MSTRALISLVLLLVQLLGLAHLAVSEHVVTSTGALVDAAGLLEESHSHAVEHLCADDVTLHALAGQDDCVVGAVWKSSLVSAPVLTALRSPRASVARRRLRSVLFVGRSALFVAPKASPPLS